MIVKTAPGTSDLFTTLRLIDPMERRSTTDPAFLRTVSQWIQEDGEVFVVIRYPNMGGVRDYEFILVPEEFVRRVSHLRPSTSVVICRGEHLPLRGTVDESFITRALETIPDGDEWLIVSQTPLNHGVASRYPHAKGETHEDLESDLREDTFFGQPVCAGVVPPWWLDDSDVITSAFVPDADGSITPAAY